MASVALETVLIGLGSDLSQQVSLDVSEIADEVEATGQVRTYANGRRRVILSAARPVTVTLKLDVVANRPQLATLRSWAGQRVLLRDPFGRKVYGVFFRVAASERIPVDMPEVSITIESLTFSEAVV